MSDRCRSWVTAYEVIVLICFKIASLWYLCAPEKPAYCHEADRSPFCQRLYVAGAPAHLPGIEGWRAMPASFVSGDVIQWFLAATFPSFPPCQFDVAPGTLLGLNTMVANQIAGVLQIWSSWIFTTLSITDGWFVSITCFEENVVDVVGVCVCNIFFVDFLVQGPAWVRLQRQKNITPKVVSIMHSWWLEWTFEGMAWSLWWANSLKFLISHQEVLRSSTKVNNEKPKN